MRWGIPFAKVEAQDDGTIIVEGVATDETPDMDGEIVDYEASKEAFEEWAQWGNVREMHQLSAVGRRLEHWADDQRREIGVRAQIVDPVAVKKVLTGVYQGFSIGGKKLERRWDNGRWRITRYRMVELSLVDRPNNPSTRIALVKAAGANEFGEDILEVEVVTKEEREKLREQAEARAKKYRIAFKEGKGNLTPPKGYPEDPEQYGDPVNYAYPIDEEHIRPAVAYFNHEGQREDGGYTPEEWAIIGKRIAAAATRLLGGKYEYEGGKVKRVEEEEAKKAAGDFQKAGQPPAAGEPGSPEWERVDANLLAQAVSGLKAVVDILQRVKRREEAEWAYDHQGDVGALWEALDHLREALGIVAGLAYTEAQEAQGGVGAEEGALAQAAVAGDLRKAGRRLSQASLEKIHGSISALANLCGCPACKAFIEAMQGSVQGTGGEDVEDAAKKPKGEKNLSKAAQSATDRGLSPVVDVEAILQKVLDASGLSKLKGAVEDLLKAAQAIPVLEERVRRLEEQPAPGGPLLRGMATAQDYYLVRKGEAPTATAGQELEILEKVAAEASDPLVRDVLGREIAKRVFLAGRKTQ